ncbi:MAG: DUF4336 domain-containing protein [Gammaproteobacteria bacterium]|nr:DUF4336 domain-containing protein [Gammaproteobacteria bacterium]
MRQIYDKLWVHEDAMKLGPVVLPLRMTIVQLSNGDLWIHSPTAMSAELKDSVDALGPVAAVLGPSNGHNLWLGEWDSAYPDATTYVSPGIPKKLPTLTDYRIIDAESQARWSDDLQLIALDGAPFFDERVFLHHPSRSLIVTDLVQNHLGREHTGLAKIMTKLVLEPIGFKDICLAPPLRFRFMIKDRPAFVASIKAIQALDFDRIIVTHGDIIEADAKATLARLCERFNDG